MDERHHQLNGHEFGQTLRDSKRQGNPACCSSWGFKESDMTEQMNNNNKVTIIMEQRQTIVIVSFPNS